METLTEYYDRVIRNAKNEIDTTGDAYLLGVKVDDLVQFYIAKHQLPSIERDNSRDLEREKGRAIERMDSRLSIRTGRDIPLTIFYPIIPKPRIEDVIQRGASTSYSLSGDRLDFNGDSLTITVLLNEDDENQDAKITREIEELEKLIGWRNSDVQKGNERLKTELLKYTHQKQVQLEADNELIEKIVERVPIVLQKKIAHGLRIDLSVREEIKPIYPTAERREDLYIERDKVEAVVELLKNGGSSFETTPRVCSKLDEEDLRDILLSHLNIVFEGQATGETFVKKGKTDIHLRIDKGSILSAECKFWDGERHYLSMIEQLIGYLTWRQNYGILITFSRRKDFTNVIETAKATAQNSPTTVKSSLKVIDINHLVTINRLPEDAMKHVTLHHLLFNLYYVE